MNESTQRSPQEKVCGYEYTVRRGDSFYLIANRLGVPLRDLLEANSSINPARLMVGDVLCIPMEEDDKPPEGLPEIPETPVQPPLPSPPEEPVESERPSEAQPDGDLPGNEDLDAPAVMPDKPTDGETPVCPENHRHTVSRGETVADLQLRANLNRYTLQQANPSANLDSLAEGQVLCIPEKNTACPVAETYRLQQEDTIDSVALRLNVSLSALLRANPCLSPSDFMPGMCINVPQ